MCDCDRWLERQAAGLPGRCVKHAAMMKELYEAWPTRTFDAAIYRLSDGFGPNTDPTSVEWDWSGIRDSTPAAVEAMHAALKERLDALTDGQEIREVAN